MQPYTLINHIINDIIHDTLSAEFIRLNFADNIRFDHEEYARGWGQGPWNDPIDTIRRNSNSPIPVYHMGNWRKTNWNNDSERHGVPVYLEHQWEPVLYNFDKKLWDEYIAWQKKFKAPYVVLHSEINSLDIAQLEQQGLSTVHWFAHAYICSEFYFKHYKKIKMVSDYKNRPIQYPWISANRLLRDYRVEFLHKIDYTKGVYSLLEEDATGKRLWGSVPAHSFDVHKNHSAEIFVEELTPWNTSFLHIVNETVWQEKIHFTEKVFKPIVLHQPFVVLQAPDSLAYLRSYGFKTFGDWWDESYDTIEDPQQRMQAIADIVNAIGNKSLEELETMRMEMASVLEHNFRHFYENIPAICLDELRKGIANL